MNGPPRVPIIVYFFLMKTFKIILAIILSCAVVSPALIVPPNYAEKHNPPRVASALCKVLQEFLPTCLLVEFRHDNFENNFENNFVNFIHEIIHTQSITIYVTVCQFRKLCKLVD